MEGKKGWKKRKSSSDIVQQIEPDGKSFELWGKCAFISIPDYANIFHDAYGFCSLTSVDRFSKTLRAKSKSKVLRVLI